MYGVVLWSNPDEGKAVIWCEDQGDLAYMKPGGLGPDPVLIEAGDLVELELSGTSDVRCVSSARLVERQAYPSLADKLIGKAIPPASKRGSAEIIKFNRKPKTTIARLPRHSGLVAS
jgi:hypothetical protein